MSITAEEKKTIIEQYGANGQDTGSPQVQIALLTQRIKNLTNHLQSNNSDQSSRRGLLKMVGQRRRLLNYLMRKDLDGYRTLIQQLGIRK